MFTQLLITGIALGSVYALISVGFALIFNVLKFSNFSHGGVMVFCAYIGYLAATRLHSGLFLTLLISAIVGGLLAMGIEVVGFRKIRNSNRDPVLYFVSTVTIATLLSNAMTIFFSSSFYSYPNFFEKPYVKLFNVNISIIDILMFSISIVALVALILLLYRTRLGVSIRAISMDSRTTSLMGVNATLIICATFFASGAFGGLAGVFLGLKYTLYPQLGDMVVKGFVASLLGGLGNITGAIVGAFLLAITETLLTSVDFIGAGLSPVVIFILVIILLFVRPQGLMGKSSIQKA